MSPRQNAIDRLTNRLLRVVVIGVLAGTTAAMTKNARDQAVVSELQAMAGTWKEISRLRDGHAVSVNELGTFTQDERGNVETRSEGRSGLRYSVRVDPTRSPKTIDYIVRGGTPAGGGNPSTTLPMRLGIYELDGDTLRICIARPGAARPQEFSSPPGQDLVLSVYRREKH